MRPYCEKGIDILLFSNELFAPGCGEYTAALNSTNGSQCRNENGNERESANVPHMQLMNDVNLSRSNEWTKCSKDSNRYIMQQQKQQPARNCTHICTHSHTCRRDNRTTDSGSEEETEGNSYEWLVRQ